MVQNGVEIEGYVENARKLERLLTSDADFAANYRKLIRKVLQEARRRVANDVRFNIGIGKDPRDAYKAVKMSVYKSIFGGNISILNRRRAGNIKTTYHAPRTSTPGQRGGNRHPISGRTLAINSYYGVDRAFLLRWLESGTKERKAGTRDDRMHGKRGSIGAMHVFSEDAPKELQQAINDIAESFADYIRKVTDE